MTQINITLQSPVCTIDKFSDVSGLSISTIRLKISQKEIPVMPKAAAKSKVMINMVAYHAKCAAVMDEQA